MAVVADAAAAARALDAELGARDHHAVGRRTPQVAEAIARGAGVAAHTVRCTDDLAPVAAWAADPDGPLLLDAKVNPGIAAGWLREAFRGGEREPGRHRRAALAFR